MVLSLRKESCEQASGIGLRPPADGPGVGARGVWAGGLVGGLRRRFWLAVWVKSDVFMTNGSCGNRSP